MADDASYERAGNVPAREKIGPGHMILVVGPSGAGKDALLQGAAEALKGDQRIVFPKRIIDRPHHPSEQHDRASPEEMHSATRAGAYALSWQAHGITYAVSGEVDDAVRAGKAVVVNTSRTIVGVARRRFEHATAFYVDASREVRARRLAARGREGEAEIAERLARDVASFAAADADVVIRNDGSLNEGIAQLVAAIQLVRKCSAS